jgi:Zn-dependent M28 family amino/carboxypeptidase
MVSVNIPAPVDQNVMVKNVIGVLPGSDAVLKKTYVMLTAHYDHIGTTDTADGEAAKPAASSTDHIYNGANDDGSGTVSVVEIAKSLASLNPRPRRSMVFMTFFGEERGLLGSRFYGRHPRVPVADTVTDLNLEQVGRTDSTEGPQINTASLTGYDYSDVTKYLEAAGRVEGVKVYLNKSASDPYFTRSDNAALAQLGVPAETLCVAFDYPDYHGLSDEWQKIDYENMARVDRMVARGLLNIANDPKAPQWNAANPKTEPFRQAQQKLTGEAVARQGNK